MSLRTDEKVYKKIWVRSMVVAIAMDINEEWLIRKYINMEVD